MDYEQSQANGCIEDLSLNSVSRLKRRFIAVDTETTGFNVNTEALLEIGATIFEDGKIVDTFSTLIHPSIVIRSYVTAINGITNNMVKDAPSESEAIKQFFDFIGNGINSQTLLVAHNASFDLKFLLKAANVAGCSCDLTFIDTIRIAKKYFPNLHANTLTACQQFFKVRNDTQHRALADATCCGQILLEMIKKVELELSENKQFIDLTIPKGEFITVFATIEKILIDNDIDVSNLRCSMIDDNTMEITNGIPLFYIEKLSGNGSYFVGLVLDDRLAKIKGRGNFETIYNSFDYFNNHITYLGISQYSEFDNYKKYICNTLISAKAQFDKLTPASKTAALNNIKYMKKINKENIDLYLADDVVFSYYKEEEKDHLIDGKTDGVNSYGK